MGGVAGDGETNSLRWQDDRGVNANYFAGAIQQRSARVSWVQRRIGLNDVVHQPTALRAHGAAERADNSRRDSLAKAIGRTNGHGNLPYMNSRRIGKARVMQIGGVNANHSEISFRIGADDAETDLAVVR